MQGLTIFSILGPLGIYYISFMILENEGDRSELPATLLLGYLPASLSPAATKPHQYNLQGMIFPVERKEKQWWHLS